MINFLQKLVFLLALLSAANIAGLAQTAAETSCPEDGKAKAVKEAKRDKEAKKALPILVSGFTPKPLPASAVEWEFGTNTETTEKAIAVDPKVNVWLCNEFGDIEVRGWQRDEVRVLIKGGKGGFKIKDRNPETNKPISLDIFGIDPKTGRAYKNNCLKAERIIIEVPYTAYVAIKNPTGGNISIDSIRKTFVQSNTGNIHIRNITNNAEVINISGSVLAEDSSGSFRLKSFEGSVTAVRLNPNEFSDTLKLENTSGSILVRDVKHKTINASSSNGDILTTGSLVRGGTYDFYSSNGSIMLQLPLDFPFQLKATGGPAGNFRSDFPNKFTTEGNPGGVRVFTGSNGLADTTINLTTTSGMLYLKKKTK